MEIIRAEQMGFCFGVQHAIDVCDKILNNKKYINKNKYILGKLVHNDFVVNNLKNKGFNILSESDIIYGKDNLKEEDLVIIRAHGVSKEILEVLKSKKVTIHDATCVFVSNITRKLIAAEKEDYSILFVGDRNHPEVKGIISYVDDIQIFEGLNDVENILIDEKKKYFLSTQTTLNYNKFQEIKNFLEKKYSNVNIFDKICGATYERQEAVLKLAPNVDVLLVVGGKDSSNTKKLYELSKTLNPNTYLIEDEAELDFEWFKGKEKIGITAGASTPEEIIKNIEKKIRGSLDV